MAGVVLAGGALAIGGDGSVAATVAAVHVLLDLDHAVEHVVQSPQRFDVAAFLSAHNTLGWNRTVFLLHAYEWAFLLWAGCFVNPDARLLAVATGVSTHLLLDEVGNRLAWVPVQLAPGFYFFSYRLGWRFLRSRLMTLRAGRTILGTPVGEGS